MRLPIRRPSAYPSVAAGVSSASAGALAAGNSVGGCSAGSGRGTRQLTVSTPATVRILFATRSFMLPSFTTVTCAHHVFAATFRPGRPIAPFVSSRNAVSRLTSCSRIETR